MESFVQQLNRTVEDCVLPYRENFNTKRQSTVFAKAVQDTKCIDTKTDHTINKVIKKQLTFSAVLGVVYNSSSLLTNVGRTKAAL